MVDRERELTDLVERRTGGGLPTMRETIYEPYPVVRSGARARRAGE
jgi:hypothetical protein